MQTKQDFSGCLDCSIHLFQSDFHVVQLVTALLHLSFGTSSTKSDRQKCFAAPERARPSRLRSPQQCTAPDCAAPTAAYWPSSRPNKLCLPSCRVRARVHRVRSDRCVCLESTVFADRFDYL